jgi:hypothetical protein
MGLQALFADGYIKRDSENIDTNKVVFDSEKIPEARKFAQTETRNRNKYTPQGSAEAK